MTRNLLIQVLFFVAVFPAACDEDSPDPLGEGDVDADADTDLDRDGDTDVDSITDTENGVDNDTKGDLDTDASRDTGGNAAFPLQVGDPVPDFSLPAHEGSTFKLSDYQGKIVLIGSHPFAGTAVCTQQTKDLETNYDKFLDLNTIPFAMGTDGNDRQGTWAADMGLQQLWILSDANPKGEASKMLGIFDNLTKTSKRAIVIIDQEGKIAFRKIYNTMICPKLDPIFEELQAMQ